MLYLKRIEYSANNLRKSLLLKETRSELTIIKNATTAERQVSGMDLNVGEIVKLKKQHPCGSFEWEILRVGMDFRLKCLGCGHQVMLPRKQVEKNIKQVRKPSDK